MIKLAALILVAAISAATPFSCGGPANGQPDGPVNISAPKLAK